MTKPAPDPRELREFLYGLASSLAIASQSKGVPQLVLPPRPPSPAARHAQVDAAVESLCKELDAVLSRKVEPPAGTPVATLGRRMVSNGAVIDLAAGTYTPGPGFAALITGLIASNPKEENR